ncbi:MAG: HDOD domain-containing protein [Polaromonas sp.]
MTETKYLQRAPLLDPMQRVLGYKLAWQSQGKGGETPVGANLSQLLNLVVEHPGKSESNLLFLDTGSAALPAEILKSLTPANTVLMLTRDDMANESTKSSVLSLRERGCGVVLRDVDLGFLVSDENLLPLVTHVEVAVDHPELVAISSHVRLTQPPFSVVVKQFSDWHEFDTCAALGLSGFFGNLCRTPRKIDSSGELGPQTVLILQLMQMVQDNADVRDLEKVLKRDATLSYKLFRYINSASFGIEVEIESLRHAVSMLGYTPLYRWLSLLLAMTNTAGFSPALLQAAIIRGRFAELLGQGLLSRSESENLFVVGMFSMLDQLLGLPLEQILRQISLPEAIAQALLSRDGVYGPFLALAEACEREDGRASDYADALFMTDTRVNQAHVAALAWAQSIKL